LSQWLADCAANSTLFKNTRVVNLPNPIDGETFSPMDKHTARTLLHLPQDKKLVLFGAMSATADPRKGFKELSQALTYLPAEYELVVFGSSQPKTAQGFKQRTHYLGQMHDNITLRLLYSAADVMIVPSLQENLSNAIMESLACGTPVVAFAIGGNSDMIDHHHNGYLAKPYEPQDLAAGIRWVLETADAAQLSNNARQTVLSRFDSDLMANRYIGLYQKILNQSVFAQSFL
jgi:glycosyltransferase involved in cell wall biosynthesis